METSGKMFVKRVDLLLSQQGKNRAALSRDLDICITNINTWARRGTIPSAVVACKNYLVMLIYLPLCNMQK